MDVVLEAFDAYLFDYVYAFLLPSPVATKLSHGADFNSTLNNYSDIPSPQNSWQWEPASQYLSFPPGKYAWMSRWSRDDVVRQATTLFLITW